jgi:hypothetical protein
VRIVFSVNGTGDHWAFAIQLSDATARALGRQPETTLTYGIDALAMTVFNRRQMPRLVQELRSAAREADDRTRITLTTSPAHARAVNRSQLR